MKKTLLIADDDEMNRMIIRKFLKNDYEIIEAENGRETLELLKTKHIDAVLLDIIMPEIDGLEVLEKMKQEEEFNHIGILVATSTKEKTERKALELGADDVVSKPYDPIVIRKRMKNILAIKEINEQKRLLQNNDTKALIHDKNISLIKNIEDNVNKIINYSNIIYANQDNHELINEITDKIKSEADNILNVINTED